MRQNEEIDNRVEQLYLVARDRRRASELAGLAVDGLEAWHAARRHRGRLVANYGVAAVVAFGLCLSTVQLVPQSVRAHTHLMAVGKATHDVQQMMEMMV